MPKLGEIAGSPGYDAAASAYSKQIIVVYVISYVYMVFAAGGDTGSWIWWIWAILVFIGGMFAVSFLLAMPFFLLMCKFPKLRLVITIADWVIAFFFTKYLFLWLLT